MKLTRHMKHILDVTEGFSGQKDRLNQASIPERTTTQFSRSRICTYTRLFWVGDQRMNLGPVNLQIQTYCAAELHILIWRGVTDGPDKTAAVPPDSFCNLCMIIALLLPISSAVEGW